VRLTDAPRVALRVPGAGGGLAVLTRQALESLAAPLFRRMRLPVDAACWQVRAGRARAAEGGVG